MSYLKDINKKRGFTLLEMLLVIAIIAILASIVIVAINPAKQIGDANNAQRNSDVLSILNAIHQYQIDNSGVITALSIPTDGSPVCDGEGEWICTGSSCSTPTGNGDLYDLLVDVATSSYLSAIPVDPLFATSSHSGYRVIQHSTSNRITVCAPLAENSETISITR